MAAFWLATVCFCHVVLADMVFKEMPPPGVSGASHYGSNAVVLNDHRLATVKVRQFNATLAFVDGWLVTREGWYNLSAGAVVPTNAGSTCRLAVFRTQYFRDFVNFERLQQFIIATASDVLRAQALPGIVAHTVDIHVSTDNPYDLLAVSPHMPGFCATLLLDGRPAQHNGIIGLAYVGRGCAISLNRAFVTGTHAYSLALTLIHELGHLMGALHTQDYPACRNDRTIMNAILSSSTQPYFGSCALAAVRQWHAYYGNSTCLQPNGTTPYPADYTPSIVLIWWVYLCCPIVFAAGFLETQAKRAHVYYGSKRSTMKLLD